MKGSGTQWIGRSRQIPYHTYPHISMWLGSHERKRGTVTAAAVIADKSFRKKIIVQFAFDTANAAKISRKTI